MALSLTESSFAAAAENITSYLLFKNQRKSSPKPQRKSSPKPLFRLVCWCSFFCWRWIFMQDCHLEISNLKPVMASHISQHPDQISTTSPSYHGVLFHKNLLFVIELPGFQVVRGAWVAPAGEVI